MKVHIGSDEKFSSGLFARLEFLNSLHVVFQFINTASVLGIGKFVRRRAFIFHFFQSCPLPASSDEVFLNLSLFTCIHFHGKNCSYKI